MKCKACGVELDGMSDKLAKGDDGLYCSDCWAINNSTDPIPFEPVRPKVIAVDCDGFLTNETCWDEEDVLNATPKQVIIDKVNESFKSNFIVIYTARRHELYDATVKWLDKHGVRYHALKMEKMAADEYWDDKCFNLGDV